MVIFQVAYIKLDLILTIIIGTDTFRNKILRKLKIIILNRNLEFNRKLKGSVGVIGWLHCQMNERYNVQNSWNNG